MYTLTCSSEQRPSSETVHEWISVASFSVELDRQKASSLCARSPSLSGRGIRFFKSRGTYRIFHTTSRLSLQPEIVESAYPKDAPGLSADLIDEFEEY